jgi:hypothetical protein
VVGRIGAEHRPRCVSELPLDNGRFALRGRSTSLGGEPVVIAQDVDHVVVARERPRAALGVEIDGVRLAQRAVVAVGIAQEVLRTPVERVRRGLGHGLVPGRNLFAVRL